MRSTWFPVVLLCGGLAASCIEEGGSGGGGSSCEDACSNMIDCGDWKGPRDVCVSDCGSEPWSSNYRECRATDRACTRSEAECENWGRDVPLGWTCSPDFHSTGDGCDCGCGVRDPDCPPDAGCTVACCEAASCDFNWNCE